MTLRACLVAHQGVQLPLFASQSAIAALGSDTGGSIRQPASYCGVVGPQTLLWQSITLWTSKHSPRLWIKLARSPKLSKDSALLLNAISGVDPADATSLTQTNVDFTDSLNEGVSGMKLGLPKEYFGDGIDPAVRSKSG